MCRAGGSDRAKVKDVAIFAASGIAGGDVIAAHAPIRPPTQDLPIVVFIDRDQPPLIDRVDDVGFGVKGKPK
jgi:hypothetical protein